MKRTRFAAALAALLAFCGCGPLPRWQVEVVRPDGATQRRFTVESRWSPSVTADWGGRLYLKVEPHKTVVTPPGWCIIVSPPPE